MSYHHVQYGYLAVPTAAVFVVVDYFSFRADDAFAWLIVAIMAFEALILGMVLWFSKLTVEVDAEAVTIGFFRGRPHRTYRMSDISTARSVRNKWYYGFGVRILPNGHMYNVWGLDAVELGLTSGKVFRIGTDDKDRLEAVITLQRRGVGDGT